MIILDTNVVSEFRRPNPDPHVVSWMNAREPTNLHLAVVTAGELPYGVFRLPRDGKFDHLSLAVSEVVEGDFDGRVLPHDGRAAGCFGIRVGNARREGKAIGLADGQIASIALAHDGSPVAMRDRKPFEMMGVDVIDPWSYPASAG